MFSTFIKTAASYTKSPITRNDQSSRHHHRCAESLSAIELANYNQPRAKNPVPIVDDHLHGATFNPFEQDATPKKPIRHNPGEKWELVEDDSEDGWDVFGHADAQIDFEGAEQHDAGLEVIEIELICREGEAHVVVVTHLDTYHEDEDQFMHVGGVFADVKPHCTIITVEKNGPSHYDDGEFTGVENDNKRTGFEDLWAAATTWSLDTRVALTSKNIEFTDEDWKALESFAQAFN